MCAELANRGVKDVLIVEGAPPARERSARGNVTGSPAFPRRTQAVLAPGHGPHLRRYHPVPRPWMRFVSYGDRRKVAAALKADLHRPEPGGRLAGSDRLLRVRHGGVKYPQTVTTWERAWERFTPFLDFPPMLRRVISPPLRGRYPLHQHDRDCELPATQESPMNRGHFPSDEAAT